MPGRRLTRSGATSGPSAATTRRPWHRRGRRQDCRPVQSGPAPVRRRTGQAVASLCSAAPGRGSRLPRSRCWPMPGQWTTSRPASWLEPETRSGMSGSASTRPGARPAGARSRHSSWRAAVSMFTVIPARGPRTIGPDAALRITMWLPAVGAMLAAPAAGIMLAVEAGGDSVPRRFLGATLAIAALALLTGGLHLDGLADTADGLGSRRPAQEALDIMRRSDTGPTGVAALALTLLLQVTSLASLQPGWLSAAALFTAVITGRVSVVLASGSPAARPGGLRALGAGTTRRAAPRGAA